MCWGEKVILTLEKYVLERKTFLSERWLFSAENIILNLTRSLELNKSSKHFIPTPQPINKAVNVSDESKIEVLH